MLPDGAFAVPAPDEERASFIALPPPKTEEVEHLLTRVVKRVTRCMTRYFEGRGDVALAQLLLHEPRHAEAVLAAITRVGKERLEVLAHDLVQHRALTETRDIAGSADRERHHATCARRRAHRQIAKSSSDSRAGPNNQHASPHKQSEVLRLHSCPYVW